MVPDEYTDRILPGEPVFLAPNGRFHRAGCRYYVAPGPQAVFVEGTFTPAFLRNSCKLCFPDGVPGMLPPTSAPASAGESSLPLSESAMPRSESPAPPAPLPPVAADVAPPLKPEVAPVAFDALGPPPPPPPAATLDPNYHPELEHGRRKKKRRRTGARTMPITGTQVAVFLVVVALAVGVFAALAVLLHWFG